MGEGEKVLVREGPNRTDVHPGRFSLQRGRSVRIDGKLSPRPFPKAHPSDLLLLLRYITVSAVGYQQTWGLHYLRLPPPPPQRRVWRRT